MTQFWMEGPPSPAHGFDRSALFALAGGIRWRLAETPIAIVILGCVDIQVMPACKRRVRIGLT